ncbi:MAG: hypothetical protein FWC56_05140, partial [Phycisphaerae bacterium]|nr:hypothetical protein [Phycisphaerae bacterium]
VHVRAGQGIAHRSHSINHCRQIGAFAPFSAAEKRAPVLFVWSLPRYTRAFAHLIGYPLLL